MPKVSPPTRPAAFSPTLTPLDSIGWPASGGPGGGSPPAWARAGSIADIDFVNNPPRAWTSAGGEISDLTDIIGDSALMGVTSNYPAAMQSGVGFGIPGDTQGVGAFIDDMADLFNFDFSAVLEFTDLVQIELTEGAFGTDIVFQYSTVGASVGIQDNGNDTENVGLKLLDGSNNPVMGSSGAHKFGATITAASMYGAIDGTSLERDDASNGTTVNPSTPNQPTDIIFATNSLQRVTIYNPVKTEAELRTLTA